MSAQALLSEMLASGYGCVKDEEAAANVRDNNPTPYRIRSMLLSTAVTASAQRVPTDPARSRSDSHRGYRCSCVEQRPLVKRGPASSTAPVTSRVRIAVILQPSYLCRVRISQWAERAKKGRASRAGVYCTI
jgi:hypothetical protein